jgi:8-oxo-dGTP pyrophosphatase MutT (NUDIX family)
MTRPGWLDEIVVGIATLDPAEFRMSLPPEDGTSRLSSVLMLFADSDDGPDILLTERAHDMRSHPGQVSFPGGSIDPGETVHEAAFREAREEIGLDPAGVEIVGQLPELYLPPSNFVVTPVVAWWHEPAIVHPVSRAEVHAIYRVPVSELRDPANRIRVRSPNNPQWITPGFLIGPDKDVLLWGFTGGIIARFFTHLGWIENVPDAPITPLPGYMLRGRERE